MRWVGGAPLPVDSCRWTLKEEFCAWPKNYQKDLVNNLKPLLHVWAVYIQTHILGASFTDLSGLITDKNLGFYLDKTVELRLAVL